MAMQFVDRVRVYSSTTGTGTLTLGAAFANAETFATAGFVVGNTSYYVIEDGNAWEVGIGTMLTSTTWGRTAVIASSNANAAINCSGNQALYLGFTAQTLIDTQSMAFYAPGRNRLRNPKFEIAQRGNGAFTTSGNYGPDGWLLASSNTAISGSIQPQSAAYAYGQSCALSSSGMAVGNSISIVQRIESYDVEDLVGLPVTVSFIGAVSATAASGGATPGNPQGSVGLYYANTKDNSSKGYTSIGQISVALTPTPTRVSVTFPALPAGAANGLSLNFNAAQVGAAGGSTILQIGAVQLEPGTFATPLEHVDIMTESAKNFRFLQQGSFLAYGYTSQGVGIGGIANILMPMRTTPTLTYVQSALTNCASPAVALVNPSQFQYSAVGSAAGGFVFEGNWTATCEI